jgi:hypothetical protein
MVLIVRGGAKFDGMAPFFGAILAEIASMCREPDLFCASRAEKES